MATPKKKNPRSRGKGTAVTSSSKPKNVAPRKNPRKSRSVASSNKPKNVAPRKKPRKSTAKNVKTRTNINAPRTVAQDTAAIKRGGLAMLRAAKAVGRFIPGSVAAEAVLLSLIPGEGLTEEQKDTLKKAGMPISKLKGWAGRQSKRVATEAEGSRKRQQQRQADKAASRRKLKDAASRRKLKAAGDQPAPKRKVVEDFPGMPKLPAKRMSEERIRRKLKAAGDQPVRKGPLQRRGTPTQARPFQQRLKENIRSKTQPPIKQAPENPRSRIENMQGSGMAAATRAGMPQLGGIGDSPQTERLSPTRGSDMAGAFPKSAPTPPVPRSKPKPMRKVTDARESVRDIPGMVAAKKPFQYPKQTDHTKGAVESLRKKKALDRAIKSAVREQDIDVPEGGKRKRDTFDASLGKRRRRLEATDKQDREWEEMHDRAPQRKGGKITKKKATKKSSTSYRSRPKNPTLQKTSYNY